MIFCSLHLESISWLAFCLGRSLRYRSDFMGAPLPFYAARKSFYGVRTKKAHGAINKELNQRTTLHDRGDKNILRKQLRVHCVRKEGSINKFPFFFLFHINFDPSQLPWKPQKMRINILFSSRRPSVRPRPPPAAYL